jgi:hypothetical protein
VAIPESQLETWTGLGSVQQSASTYQTIKNVLEHASAPYASRQIDSFLQGSYRNDTNIFGDSDVDIVLRTRSLFHYNINALPEWQKELFNKAYPGSAQYQLPDFRKDVEAWLYHNYAAELDTSGKKAFRIKAAGNRRNADVLLVAPHKKFTRYEGGRPEDQTILEGVQLITTDGKHIINYPKLHSDNLTARHQAANNLLKPTIRIFKNIRSKMVERGIVKEGTAPSYFIEGMLANVPNGHFSANRQKAVEACWGWIDGCDHGSLMCANGIHPLVRDNIATSWQIQGYIDFLEGVRNLWTQW